MPDVLFSLFAVDLIGTLLGIWALQSRPFSQKFAASSAGVMFGVALFWIFPDMTRNSSIVHAALTVAVAIAFLYAFDRYVYPVCPCCAHQSHGHGEGRSTVQASRASISLRPVVIAIFIHNFFDGWTAAVAISAGGKLQSGITAGLLAHKIPEAIIFGLILRAGAAKNLALPTIYAAATSVAILFGAAVQRGLGMLSEEAVLAASLAFACGSFLFVGFHAFLNQRRHGGIWSALKPLVFGLVVSAVLEQVVSISLAQTR